MLIRYSFYYLIARGLPGLINFTALVVYTRLLSVDDYGRYALIIAGVGVVNVIGFYWLQLVLGRFVPMHREAPSEVQRPVLGLFLGIAGLICVLGLLMAFFWPEDTWRGLIALAVPLLLAHAWNELGLAFVSARLEPARYGRLVGGKSLLSLLVGVALIFFGFGVYAPVLGLLTGIVVAWLLFGLESWRGIRPVLPSGETLRAYAGYGLPLVVTFALGWVLTSSDRLLIGWMSDEQYAGVYAVGYDVAQQSLGLIMVIVNTAAYPLVLHQMETGGAAMARKQLSVNGELVLTLALVCGVGLIVLAPEIIALLIGADFRSGALLVMPWIAASAAVEYVKAFHFDVAFHLSRQSRWLVITGIISAGVNIGLNLLLIPRYGIVGAAWATLASFVVAALFSSIFGRRVFFMPSFAPILIKAVFVALFAYLGLWVSGHMGLPGALRLVAGVVAGAVMSCVGAFMLDVSGFRKSVLKRLFG
jgi:O-antigen/teichoic acid export membrane protein